MNTFTAQYLFNEINYWESFKNENPEIAKIELQKIQKKLQSLGFNIKIDS